MLKRRKLLLILSVILCFSFTPAVHAASPVKVFLNGNEVLYDVPAQIVTSRTMVPLSQTIQAITGSPAEWNAATKTVTFHANGRTNIHKIGEKIVYADGVPTYFDSPSLILDGRTLVPIRMIAETSGAQVDWDANNHYVIITGKSTPIPVPAQKVEIKEAKVSKSTVNEGEAVTVTIRTNSAAKYVWILYSNPMVKATLVSTDAAGVKTWTATCYPMWTTPLVVYANSEELDSTATKLSLDMNVTPRSSVPKLNGVSASRTSIYEGEQTFLTIKTNTSTKAVWVEYDNTTVNANYQYMDTAENKIWNVACYPRKTQHLIVYANTSQAASGFVTDSVRIEVTPYNPTPTPSPSPSTAPKINSSICTVDDYGSIMLVVTTNAIVEQVDITPGIFNAETLWSPSSSSGSNRTWTYIFDPPPGFADAEITFSIAAYANNQTARDKATARLNNNIYWDYMPGE